MRSYSKSLEPDKHLWAECKEKDELSVWVQRDPATPDVGWLVVTTPSLE